MLNTEFENADASPGFALWRLSNIWQARQRATLVSFNLTHVQFVLLAALTYASDDRMTQKELAVFIGVDVMMTSQVLRRLEEKGLIMRQRGIEDKRAIHLEATPKGIELVNRAIRAVEATDREFFKPLGNRADEFVSMMRRLIQ